MCGPIKAAELLTYVVPNEAVRVSERLGLNAKSGVGDHIQGVRHHHVFGVKFFFLFCQIFQVVNKFVPDLIVKT